MIALSVEPNSRVPIYVQLEQQLRALIAAGRLQPGDQLPTIRELAAELRVNYNTIARVYFDLDREGLISTQQGRGTFVAGRPDADTLARSRQAQLEAVVGAALDEAHRLGYAPVEIAPAFAAGLAARWPQAAGAHIKED
jgi:GntR family transcriptional regulator